MTKLSAGTKHIILARDQVCVVCHEAKKLIVYQLRAGDDIENGVGICHDCDEAIKRREVGIAGSGSDPRVTDGRQQNEEELMAKKKKATNVEVALAETGATDPSQEGTQSGPEQPVSHRVTTFKPNGAESQEVAPAPSSPDSGPVVMPSADQALEVLRVLADLTDRAIQMKKRYEDAKQKAKDLKAKWDELAEEIQTTIRAATHGSDLPLFDATEREADLSAMERAAAEAGPAARTDSPIDEIPAEDIPF